jgi:hypothetical protein
MQDGPAVQKLHDAGPDRRRSLIAKLVNIEQLCLVKAPKLHANSA